MKAIRAERVQRTNVKVLQDVEHHQRSEPLCIWRNLHEVEPAIIGRNRRNRVAAMAREILRGKERVASRKRYSHVVGDFALVESTSTLRGDGLQRRRKRRKANNVAFLGCSGVEKVVPGRSGIGLELDDVSLPVPGHAGADGKSALGIFDRWRQRAIETKPAMRLQDFLPGFDRSGYGDRMDGVANFSQTLRAQRLIGRLHSRTTRTVVTPDRLARPGH